jgi:hypothetical protein
VRRRVGVGRRGAVLMPPLVAPFTRILKPGDPIERGIDIEGIGRALCRAKIGYVSLNVFTAMPATWRRSYGSRKIEAVNVIRKREGRTRNGIYDQGVHGVLIDMGAFDARAVNMMYEYEPPLAYCYPIAKARQSWVCQSLHETSGIPGNWAIDFCVPEIVGGNGAPVLAVQDAFFYRYGGKAPTGDVPDPSGAYGWSVYYQTRGGVIYYTTHLGQRVMFAAGQRIKAGTIVGYIGDQWYRPDHAHVGATHPRGEAEAKKLILRISTAPRVNPVEV